MAEIDHEGIFGRHFQSLKVRGQISFSNFCLFFFVAGSLLEGVFFHS